MGDEHSPQPLPEPGQPARPTLGVLLFNLNLARYLPRAIETIVDQSLPPDQVVVVDGGSTDGSLEIIQEFQARYPSVRLIVQEQRGMAEAFRLGSEALRTDYFYMACSDDYLLPQFFELLMGLAEQYPQAGVVSGMARAVTPRGAWLTELTASSWKAPTYAAPERFMKEYLAVEPPMHSMGAATIYRRAALDAIGGVPFGQVSHWCDTVALRAVALGHGMAYTPEACVVWTVRGDSITQSTWLDQEKRTAELQRAAALMRSPGFRERFPEEYVRRWEQECARSYEFYSRPAIRLALSVYTRLVHVPFLNAPLRAAGEWIRRRSLPTGRRESREALR